MASILFLLLLGSLVPNLHMSGAESIGVCYGKLGNNLPPDSEVIELYKTNGIQKMRIYWPRIPTLEALRGSDIELILDVPRESLQTLTDPSAASDWVQNNVAAYSSDVKFRYIAVGNEISPASDEAKYVHAAMQNVQAAISAANLQSQIKVSTAIAMSLVDKSYPPNDGVFADAAEGFIGPIVRFLAENGSPILANVYPYFSYIWQRESEHPIDINYALFRSEGVVVPDGTRYRSLFEAQVDAVYAAVEKMGAAGVTVVVAESGWPSEGDRDATVENARAYYGNLIERVKSGSGTPKRPQGQLQAYLFAMFDENDKNGDAVENHFGLFSPDKHSKYQLNFN